MTEPDIHYIEHQGGYIGYEVAGTGPIDSIFIPNWAFTVYPAREMAEAGDFFEQLRSIGRVVLYDAPGTGLSDPPPSGGSQTIEMLTETTRAVLDAAGIDRAAVFATDTSVPIALTFAATYPDRTRALVLTGGYARFMQDEDAPWGLPESMREAYLRATRDAWMAGNVIDVLSPRAAADPVRRSIWRRWQRLTASPNQLMRFMSIAWDLDVRAILPAVRVPTLVIHARDDAYVPVEHGRYLARTIEGARYVEWPSREHYLLLLGEELGVFEEIRGFLTGVRQPVDADRVLSTFLLTDIVDSSARAQQLGDRDWRRVLDAHDSMARDRVALFRGHEVKQTGDGILAMFDGPARAVRCAEAIRQGARGLGLEVRAGVHTGECELRGEDVGGIAVHVAARVMASAEPGAIFTSSTVRDLVAGSGLTFEDRGERELKGVGVWRLFEVTGT